MCQERTADTPTLPPLQRPVGELSSLRWQPEGCGKWIPADFRLCVADSTRKLQAWLKVDFSATTLGIFSAKQRRNADAYMAI